MQVLKHHLVERACQIDDLIAAGLDLLALRQAHGVLYGVGGGEVDGLLALRHILGVLLERELMVFGGVEDEQIAQKVLISAVLVAHAALEVVAEVSEELLVLLAVVVHELFKLTLDALFNILADDGKLSVVLKQLS